MRYYFACFFLVASFAYSEAIAQETSSPLIPIEGIVVNKQTSEPVVAASVRVQGTNRGTYTGKDGKFRLPLPQGSYKALIRSLGYEALEITLEAKDGVSPVRVELLPAIVKLGAVDVIAEVSAAEIVRRAIANKDANRAKLRSSSGLVYSKTAFDIAVPKGLSLFLSKERQAQVERMKNAQLETFTRVEKQYTPSLFTRKTILQRRQTANIPAESNTLVFDEFFDFTDPVLTVNGTRLSTPLGASALDSYQYIMLDRKQLGDRTVYIIGFKPKAEIFPGFEGTVQIIEGNYAIVQISAKPTAKTAMKFVTELSFFQKFERFNNKMGVGEEAEVWLPTLLETNYSFSVEFVAGLAEVGIALKTRSIVSELDVNPALPANFAPAKKAVTPDGKPSASNTERNRAVTVRFGNANRRNSLKPAPPKASSASASNASSEAASSTTANAMRSTTSMVTVAAENENSILAVSAGADSVSSGFWETNALTELTPEEKETYRRVDSVVKALPPDTAKSRSTSGGFGLWGFRLSTNAAISFFPAFNMTRSTGWLYGAQVKFQWEAPGENDTFAALFLATGVMNLYHNKFFGDTGLKLDVATWDEGGLSLMGEAFSTIGSLQNRRLLGERFTRLPFGYILYQHFLDFYRQEGFGAGFLLNNGSLDAALGVQQYSITNLPTILPNERSTTPANAGTYRIFQAEASWNIVPENNLYAFASFMDDPQTSVRARFVGRYGQEVSGGEAFGSVEGRVELLQPTFYTGYAPMFLRLSANAGYASRNAPLQEQFIAFRRLAIAGRTTDFATIPINGLAGTEFVSFHAEHNFSDMLWRLVACRRGKGGVWIFFFWRKRENIMRWDFCRFSDRANTANKHLRHPALGILKSEWEFRVFPRSFRIF